ncbi:MAG: cell division protein FtsL [Pseudomonadota bacterium]
MSQINVPKIALVFALITSSFALVYSSHVSRERFNELEGLKRVESELLMRWGRLVLEESALSSLARVEYLATQRIGMKVPHVSEVQVVTP